MEPKMPSDNRFGPKNDLVHGPWYDEEMLSSIRGAIDRLRADLRRDAPFAAERVDSWLRKLSRGDSFELYITHPNSYPLTLITIWLNRMLADDGGAFLQDVIRSTLAGYYFIRLVDNVMDSESTVETSILPVSGFFHSQFTAPYRSYFPAGHAFWRMFDRTWGLSVEATVQDAFLRDIDEDQFRHICARKFLASRIPIAAHCHHYERMDLLPQWSTFVDALGCWHQMANDFFGWAKDILYGHRTFFLSEADRQRAAGTSRARWILETGLDWGEALLDRWMQELREMAGELRCPPLEGYLASRSELHHQRLGRMRQGGQAWLTLASTILTPDHKSALRSDLQTT